MAGLFWFASRPRTPPLGIRSKHSVVEWRSAQTLVCSEVELYTSISDEWVRFLLALLGSLAALNPQLHADGNMFLISQLFKTRKELDRVNENTNSTPAKPEILSSSPIAAILDPGMRLFFRTLLKCANIDKAMHTIEEALGFINRHVILRYVESIHVHRHHNHCVEQM